MLNQLNSQNTKYLSLKKVSVNRFILNTCLQSLVIRCKTVFNIFSQTSKFQTTRDGNSNVFHLTKKSSLNTLLTML